MDRDTATTIAIRHVLPELIRHSDGPVSGPITDAWIEHKLNPLVDAIIAAQLPTEPGK